MSEQFYIPQVAPNVFESANNNRYDAVVAEPKAHFLIDTWKDKDGNYILDENGRPRMKIEYGNGINVYIIGAPYPKKGFPNPEVIWSANQAKKVFLEGIKVFGNKWFVLGFVFNWKKLLKTYNEIAMKSAEPFIMKDEYLAPVAKQLKYMIYNFLAVLNVDHKIALNFAKVASFIIDIDDAYRYRLGDLCSETSKELLLSNPAKELERLLSLNRKRELRAVHEKVKPVGDILRVLLLIPKYKRAFEYAVQNCDFDKMKLDDADKYWVLFKPDYDYMGLSYETRQKLIDAEGQRPTLFSIK